MPVLSFNYAIGIKLFSSFLVGLMAKVHLQCHSCKPCPGSFPRCQLNKISTLDFKTSNCLNPKLPIFLIIRWTLLHFDCMSLKIKRSLWTQALRFKAWNTWTTQAGFLLSIFVTCTLQAAKECASINMLKCHSKFQLNGPFTNESACPGLMWAPWPWS